MKYLIILLSMLALTGCASSPKMSMADLQEFRIDCANKDVQQRFLEKQLPTKDERSMISMNVFADPELRNAMMSRQYDAQIRGLLWDLRHQCPNKSEYDYEYEKNGCNDLRTKHRWGKVEDNCVHSLDSGNRKRNE